MVYIQWAIPTSSKLALRESLSLLVLMRQHVWWASAYLGSCLPYASPGGLAIITLPIRVMNNFYHSTWLDAIGWGTPFNAIHIIRGVPRDEQSWYDQRWLLHWVQKRTAQEIDGDFLSSGNTVFDIWRYQGYRRLLK